LSQAGLLTAVDDPSALAAALARALDDPNSMAVMAHRARSLLSRFSRETMVDRTLELLAQAGR